MTNIIIALINAVGSMVAFIIPDVSISQDVVVNVNSVVDFAVDLLNKVSFLIPLDDVILIIMFDFALRVMMVAAFGANLVVRRVFDVIP